MFSSPKSQVTYVLLPVSRRNAPVLQVLTEKIYLKVSRDATGFKNQEQAKSVANCVAAVATRYRMGERKSPFRLGHLHAFNLIPTTR